MCAFTQLNMTFQRTCTYQKKKKKAEEAACTHKYTHTLQRPWESQNAEPEGCCASDVCIVYSVVPVHVGDCCTFLPQSSLVLLALTAVDSRLLSRRAARLCKGRKRWWWWGRQRSKETKRSLSIPFPPIFVHILLSSLFGLCFDPLSSNLCPHGSPAVRQSEEGAASLLILSSLTFRHLGYTSFCTQGIIWEP